MPLNQELIETPIGVVRIIDITPDKLKTEIPVLIAPGWGETPRTFQESANVMAGKGRRTLSLAHPRFGKISETNLELRGTYRKQELRRALTLLYVLEQKGIEKADVVAHSTGAVDIAVAASIKPERFRNIVLFAPGGMTGKGDISVIKRLVMNLQASMLRAINDPENVSQRLMRGGTETLKYFLKNPPRAIMELIEVLGKTDISGLLEALHGQGHRISIIQGVDDRAIPMEKIQKVANTKQIHGFYSIQGDHLEIYAQPERYMGVVNEALTALENKS